MGSVMPPQYWLPRAVKSSGADSPAMRATPKIMPVRIPLLPAGTTTEAIVFHLLAPNARAPSRRDRGTSRRNCSVWRVTMGISITLSATEPAYPEFPWNGTTINAHARIPTMIDGTPFSRSATYRTMDANLLSSYSDR